MIYIFMMNPEYKKYLEEISKKLDRLNQAGGNNPTSVTSHNTHIQNPSRGGGGDGFNDDILDIMGSSAMKWMEKNNKI